MTYVQYRRGFSELAEKHRDDHLALRLKHRDEYEALKLKHRDERRALHREYICEAAIEILKEWDTAHGLNQTRVLQDGHIVTIPVAK